MSPMGRFSRVAVSPCAANCDFCYRRGKGLKDWLGRRCGYDVINSSIITNSKERTQRDLRERTLAIVKRQKVLSDKVLALYPKCKGCKRALLSQGPLRPASTFSWAYTFRSSHGSTQKCFVRHWLPWALTFQGDTPPLQFWRELRGAFVEDRAPHRFGGSSKGSCETGWTTSRVPQTQRPKFGLDPGAPRITVSQVGCGATWLDPLTSV